MVGPLRTTGRWTVGTPARILRACVEGCHPAIAMAPDQEEQGPETAIMDRALGCVLEVGHDPILVHVLRRDHRPWDPHTTGPTCCLMERVTTGECATLARDGLFHSCGPICSKVGTGDVSIPEWLLLETCP
jgi:hypothetical protein